MLLQLLVMALATMTYAQGDFKELSQNTCGMLSRWTLASNASSSLSYVSQGKANILSLDSNCESRLESALSSCFIDSKESCTSFVLSWDLLGHPGQESVMKFKRSPTGQDITGCSCMAQYPSTTNGNMATTTTGTLISALPSATTCSTGSVSSATGNVNTSISSVRSITSSAQPLQSPTTTAQPSSVSEPVCIIKFKDLNSNPPGKCYCSNGTTREWKTGECEVYS